MVQALWLVGLPLGAATLVYLLRRLRVGALIAAFIALLLAWLVVRIPTGVVLNLLGRTVELDEVSQVVLFLMFAATAILFVNLIFLTIIHQRAARLPIGLSVTGQEGRVFYPAALVVLGLFVAASLSRHLGITAIFIELAAILTVFVIQTERLESTRAALRFLILTAIATPVFLLAAWDIDNYQLTGGASVAESLNRIALFVGLGFAIWLGVVPFHSWLTSTAAESTPPTAAFVLITFPLVTISTLIHLLGDLPWLADSAQLINAVVIAGVATALVGGVLAGLQRGFGELMGYTALYDLGCVLVMLGLGGPAALLTILVWLTVRTLALVLISVSMSTINILTTNAGFSQVRGVAYQMPVATIGLILGGLTLAGAPFTAGFAPFWQLIQALAGLDPRGTILLLAGGLGVSIGYLRGLRATLVQDPSAKTSTGRLLLTTRSSFAEPRPLLVLIVVLSAACLLLGVFPGWLIEPLRAFVGEAGLPIF